jgi:hypothetical protein
VFRVQAGDLREYIAHCCCYLVLWRDQLETMPIAVTADAIWVYNPSEPNALWASDFLGPVSITVHFNVANRQLTPPIVSRA